MDATLYPAAHLRRRVGWEGIFLLALEKRNNCSGKRTTDGAPLLFLSNFRLIC